MQSSWKGLPMAWLHLRMRMDRILHMVVHDKIYVGDARHAEA